MGRNAALKVLIVGVALLAAGTTVGLLTIDAVLVQAASTALLGVGGSVIAAAFVARLIARSVRGIDVDEAIDSLKGQSPMTRSAQSIYISLDDRDGVVHVAADHTFIAHPLRRGPSQFKLGSSLARWGMTGGIESVTTPNREWSWAEDDRRPDFDEQVLLKDGDFVTVESSGEFRRQDGFSWTIDHVSKDLFVRIQCCPALAAGLTYQVSHHRRDEINGSARDKRRTDGSRLVELRLNTDTLPFQGFEVRWTDAR